MRFSYGEVRDCFKEIQSNERDLDERFGAIVS